MTQRAKPKAPPLTHLQILLSLSPIAVMYSVYSDSVVYSDIEVESAPLMILA